MKLLYTVALILSLSNRRLDSQRNEAQIRNIIDDSSNDDVVSRMKQWELQSIIRSICCIVGWILACYDDVEHKCKHRINNEALTESSSKE